MKSISTYISDLLMRQDNLILPELGGFVARRIPAKLADDGTKISPPYKQLLFHNHLNLSDGVFERYIAFRTQLDLSEAQALVSTCIQQWLQELKNGERIEIDKVGFLFLDKENKIRFEQDRAYNLLLQSYALGDIVFENKVAAVAVLQTRVSEPEYADIALDINEKIVQLQPNPEEPQKVVMVQDAMSSSSKSRPIWMKVAAAAVILPFAFYSFWVPLTTDVLETKKVAFSDFNPFHKSSQAKYNLKRVSVQAAEKLQIQDLDQIVNSLPHDAVFYNFNYDDEFVLPVRLDPKPKADQTDDKEAVVSSVAHSTNTSSAKIHLISGCFGLKENADRHIASLKAMGLDAYLVDVQGGLHRVAAIGVANDGELSTAASRLREKNVEFWTLKK